jgi:hypothetical protein
VYVVVHEEDVRFFMFSRVVIGKMWVKSEKSIFELHFSLLKFSSPNLTV